MDVSKLSVLDRSLHDMGMLSTITESRHEYLQELSRRRSNTLDSCTRCAFHVLQINSSFVKTITPGRSRCKRASLRAKPYHTPEKGHSERTRTKSENSDNENFEGSESKSAAELVNRVTLYKSKSLENINTSSHETFTLEQASQDKTDDAADVEFVSSKIKYLNVSNK